MNKWALEAESIYFGKQDKLAFPTHLPAILDTGTSLISLPPSIFDPLINQLNIMLKTIPQNSTNEQEPLAMNC